MGRAIHTNTGAARVHHVTLEDRTVNPNGKYLTGQWGACVVTIKISAQEVLLTKSSMINVDPMESTTSTYDRRGRAGSCLTLPFSGYHRLHCGRQAGGH